MKKQSILGSLIVSLIVFVIVVVAAAGVIVSIESASGKAETEQVYQVIRAATLTCYAVEGAYPSDLEYLKENYGLIYDEDLYVVTYDSFASNIFPDIFVAEGGTV